MISIWKGICRLYVRLAMRVAPRKMYGGPSWELVPFTFECDWYAVCSPHKAKIDCINHIT